MYFIKWFLVIILFSILVLGAISWYFSNQILVPKPYSLMPEFEILAISKETVTLPILNSKRQFADTRRLGKYNLLWEDGYGSLGNILEEDTKKVVREFKLRKGNLPLKGTPARIDNWYYRENPLEDYQIPYEELSLTGPVGMLKAWWLPNNKESKNAVNDNAYKNNAKQLKTIKNNAKTAIMVLHGRRRGEILETLRIIPTLYETGYPVLAMSYRNHSGSDMSPDGYYHYGLTEWEDAMIGIEFLKEKGIENIIIYAFSTGCEVTFELLERLENDQVTALILDSPMVDARGVIKHSSKNSGASSFLTNAALQVASWRARINWQKLDKREVVAKYDIPILVIAGTADSTVPINAVDKFASNVTAPLTYKRIEGIEHIEAWNHNTKLYEAWVRDFLDQLE